MTDFNESIYFDNIRKLRRAIDFTKKHNMQTPLFMSFLVTNRCTLKCKHCFYHEYRPENPFSSNDKELTLEQYHKISLSMNPIIKAIFAGGEPFLRDDLYEIVHTFVKNNKVINVDICTNGQDEKRIVNQIEKILKMNPYTKVSLAFSIDGFKECHDIIRGKDTFDNCIRSWKECRKLTCEFPNLEMYISTTINTINEFNIPQFILWCEDELRPAFVALLKTRQNPRDGEYLKRISLDNYDRCIECLKNEISKSNMGDVNHPQTYYPVNICNHVAKTLRDKQKSFYCYAGKYGGFVDYNGDVGVCEVLPSIANLKNYNYNFNLLWNDIEISRLRDQANNHRLCQECTHETEGIIPSLYFNENWNCGAI